MEVHSKLMTSIYFTAFYCYCSMNQLTKRPTVVLNLKEGKIIEFEHAGVAS